jgi:hypothetical protein
VDRCRVVIANTDGTRAALVCLEDLEKLEEAERLRAIAPGVAW